jgi:hypothetical protein
MGERFIASEQYDDLKGTIAIDGHEGHFLHQLRKYVEAPDGYWPVGLSLSVLKPNEKGKIPFTLVCVKTSEAGGAMDEIIQFAKTAEELQVYRFDGEVEADELWAMIKRLDIKLLDRNLEGANVVSYRP